MKTKSTRSKNQNTNVEHNLFIREIGIFLQVECSCGWIGRACQTYKTARKQIEKHILKREEIRP